MSNLSINRVNGNATIVTAGDRTWYFSYGTCVAFEHLTDNGVVRVRRESNYSVTTAKHMNAMGVKDWKKLDDTSFERVAAEVL